jgi:hypothetical protein
MGAFSPFSTKYISKVDLTEIADRLNEGCEEKSK